MRYISCLTLFVCTMLRWKKAKKKKKKKIIDNNTTPTAVSKKENLQSALITMNTAESAQMRHLGLVWKLSAPLSNVFFKRITPEKCKILKLGKPDDDAQTALAEFPSDIMLELSTLEGFCSSVYCPVWATLFLRLLQRRSILSAQSPWQSWLLKKLRIEWTLPSLREWAVRTL